MADKKSRQTKRQTKAKAKANGAKGGRPSKARGVPNSSDTADARWTVRGVPANIREMATKAAKSRGMTVGDWLAEVIATADKHGVSADGKGTAVAMPQSELIDLVSKMDERLTSMEHQSRQGFFSRWFGGQDGRQEAA